MPARYAVYYAPPLHSAFWHFGRSWLGRCADTGEDIERTEVPSIAPELVRALTEAPSLYGWHATLKAPFSLRSGTHIDDLLAAAREFGANFREFEIPPLALARLGDFLALLPSRPAPALSDFAAAVVEGLDEFRATPSLEELERRRSAGLTSRQLTLLSRWGYPYVMDEFRFHMTLTSALEPDVLRMVEAALGPLVAPFRDWPLRIDQLAVFCQEEPGRPFRVVERIPLSAASVRSSTTKAATDSAGGASLRNSATSLPTKG